MTEYAHLDPALRSLANLSQRERDRADSPGSLGRLSAGA